MTTKQRLSVSVDADLMAAAERAVAAGEAPTLSAWVSDAMRTKIQQSQRLRALRNFISGYEREHGEITEQESEANRREARRRAVSVRGLRAGESRRRYNR
jgi:hypothetical protein